MPWQLEISIIDVGQGDSSLIIATDGNQTRSMLIDAGEGQCAQIVHDYVRGRLAHYNAPLDHMLVTHYDDDHVGGILQLLRSDNLAAISNVVATGATSGYNAVPDGSRGQRIAAAAAGGAAAARGAYGLSHVADVAVEAAERAGKASYRSGREDSYYASEGANKGREYADSQPGLNPWLIRTPQSTKRAATAAALRLINGAAAGGTTASRVFGAIKNAVTDSFWTNRRYINTQVIDSGARYVPDLWPQLIAGTVSMWADAAPTAPAITRRRLSLGPADLGREILWNSGAAPIPAPAGAPAIFVVAAQSSAWQGGHASRGFASSQPKNDQAIGLVVRFGQFFYYTGDDLPTVGEDLIGAAVRANGFDNPQSNQTFAPAGRIAAFKCGHHGADGSTSDTFLQALDARTALISCGTNQFGTGDRHPTQNVIDRINIRVPRFYLTNCKYVTNHIPASNGVDQLTDVTNRSRVCGDNADHNLAVGRHRGDARLFLSQAESTAQPGAGRRFHVEYYDHDDLPHQPNILVGLRTEDITY